MKYLIKSVCFLFVFLSLFSCKKKYDKDFVGPQGRGEISFNLNLVDSLSVKDSIADFSITNTIPFFFNAKFDKAITWKLTITGDTSGAVKTFVGTSAQIDEKLATWNGNQDSLYFFTNETCKVTLSDYYPIDNNISYNTLSENAILNATKIKITTSISIFVKNPRPLRTNEALIFDIKRTNGKKGSYTIGYDSENCSSFSNVEASEDVFIEGEVTCLSKAPLPFALNPGPIARFYKPTAAGDPVNSPYYFILKGKDSYNKDYYIGRVEKSRASIPKVDELLNNNSNVSPEDLWFNVFVYGTGDGSNLNYTVKEDDDRDGLFNKGRSKRCDVSKEYLLYLDSLKTSKKYGVKTMDDAFEYAIKLNFKGWKLFSIRYKDFGQVPVDGLNSNGIGERNPKNILSIQFSLVAPKQDAPGQAIFDYPVMTIGGPLKY